MKKEGKYRPAVFVLAYAKNTNGVEYLILKRKLHWKGWEFPKGGIEKSDGKNLIRTIKRELKEETGLDALKIKRFNFSGKYNYDKIYSDRKGFAGQSFRLFSAEVKKSKKIKLDRLEHAGFEWMKFSKAIKKLSWQNQKKSLRIVDEWIVKNSS